MFAFIAEIYSEKPKLTKYFGIFKEDFSRSGKDMFMWDPAHYQAWIYFYAFQLVLNNLLHVNKTIES